MRDVRDEFIVPPAHLGQPHPDRAKQFKPFAALRGYYDMVGEMERIPEPRRYVTEERALRLSSILGELSKGDLVRVTYFDGEAYVQATGMVSDIQAPLRRLMVVRTRIAFDDIWQIDML